MTERRTDFLSMPEGGTGGTGATAEQLAQIQQNTHGIAELKGDLADKIDKPSTAPAVGKILKVTAVNDDGSFICEWADAPAGGGVTDVQINEVSIVQNGVANIPWGSQKQAGIFMIKNSGTSGITRSSSSPSLEIDPAVEADIGFRRFSKPIIPTNLDYAVKAAMCDGKGAAWTDTERIAALLRMGCTVDDNGFVKWEAAE